MVKLFKIPSMNVSSIARLGSSTYVLDLKHNSLIVVSEGINVHHIPYKAYGMASDRYGNVWLATYGGLIRFDGARFIRVTRLPAYAVSVDRRSNVWFSGRGYVSMYDRRKGTIHIYDGIRAEFLALSRRGVWLVRGQKVYFLDTRANEIVRSITLLSEVRAITSDRKGDLWLAMKDGLTKILTDFTTEHMAVGDIHSLDHARELFYGKEDIIVSIGRRGTIYYTPGVVSSLLVERGVIIAGTTGGSLYFINLRARFE